MGRGPGNNQGPTERPGRCLCWVSAVALGKGASGPPCISELLRTQWLLMQTLIGLIFHDAVCFNRPQGGDYSEVLRCVECGMNRLTGWGRSFPLTPLPASTTEPIWCSAILILRSSPVAAGPPRRSWLREVSKVSLARLHLVCALAVRLCRLLGSGGIYYRYPCAAGGIG